MFQPNKDLLQQYSTNNPASQETLIDFGKVPEDPIVREDWQAEMFRFLKELSNRGYQFRAAMFDGDSGISPLYTVRLDKMDFTGPSPADLDYLQWNINQLCQPGQTTEIHERVLEVHVLGDVE